MFCVLPMVGYAKNCGSTEFLFTGNCYTCFSGCYCVNHSKKLDPLNTISVSQAQSWCNKQIESCDHSGRNGYGLCGYSDIMNRCPSSFPKSDPGATSSEDCYVLSGSTKLHYRSIACMRGKYLPAGSESCADCRTGEKDFCTGGRSLYPSVTQDQGISTCPDGKKATANHMACEDMPAATVCPAGTYLRADSTSCTQCPSDFICPGGSYSKQSYDQGKESCEGNSVPNANHTACVSGDVNCIAGTYLPANTKTCAACPDGYVCAGGAFSQQPIDRGKERCSGDKVPNEQKTACVSCAAGQKPNDDNTACSDADIVVSPGWYLPANAVQQRQCFGEKKYCPGGEYSKKSTEQGRFDCPYNSNPTKNRAACELKLTKDQLKFGPLGKQGSIECWAMTSPEDYTACVYGVRTNK